MRRLGGSAALAAVVVATVSAGLTTAPASAAAAAGRDVYVVLADQPAPDDVPATPGAAGDRLATLQSAPAHRDREVVERLEDDALEVVEATRQAAEGAVRRALRPRATFRFAATGFSVELTAQEADAIARLPGVTGVHRAPPRRLLTDAGPAWIGAPQVWAAEGGGAGEGVVVGVIDSGVNPSNPAFADVGGDGHDHDNPRRRRFGVCDPRRADFDPAARCNDKLIGMYGWPRIDGGSPVDNDGHGSHVAGAAVGNVTTVDFDFPGPAAPRPRQISGVAPHANLISYKACRSFDQGGACPGDALLGAIDQAIADRVDVLNYSIGIDEVLDPWSDVETLFFLRAREAGIAVVVSAGNAGPRLGSITSPAGAPWVTSVAATSHDRVPDDPDVSTPAAADVVPEWSSRGPNPAAATVAPKLGAPGVDILAPSGSGDAVSWALSSGTSMAAPHVAGAVALLRQAYPDRSVSEIESALMTTAVTDVRRAGAGGVPPLDVGAGRVDVARALAAPLVLDETVRGFLLADPARGGRPESLNLAGLADDACADTCVWRRRLRSVAAGPTTWTASATGPDPQLSLSVSPGAFTLAPGETVEVTVRADVAAAPLTDGPRTGAVTLTPDLPGVPATSLPVVVTPAAADLPSQVAVRSLRGKGTWKVDGLAVRRGGAQLRYTPRGLVPATVRDLHVPVDRTPDPVDSLRDVVTLPLDVPSGARRLVVETLAATPPDVDVYVYRDGDGDGPEHAEEVCAAVSPTPYERCDLVDPERGAYVVVVQGYVTNRAGGTVRVATAVVPGQGAANPLGVQGPAAPTAMPFSLTLTWDVPALSPDAPWYGVLDVGQQGGPVDAFGTLPVDLVHGGGGPGPADGAVDRVGGLDRVETSVRLARTGWGPDDAEAVLLARSDHFADALAASPLAAAVDGPVVLTGSRALDTRAMAEIRRLRPATVYLLGGRVALAPAIEEALAGRIGVEVRRLQGPDRYATAAAIAQEVRRLRGRPLEEALVAVGGRGDGRDAWPDALAAASLATRTGAPVLLTTPGRLPEPTREALDAVLAPSGRVTLLGGDQAISAAQATAIGDGRPVRRLWGASRYGTAAEVARAAVADGAPPAVVGMASGGAFPDALAAGPALWRLGGVLLLSPPHGFAGVDPVERFLTDHRPTAGLVAGGPVALREAVVDQLRARLG